MPHPVVYRGDMAALIKEWEEKYRKAWYESGEAGIRSLKIGDGQCARLPQEQRLSGTLAAGHRGSESWTLPVCSSRGQW